MSQDLFIKKGVVIDGSEFDISASRAGGPGGQHVNKASTAIMIRWNVDRSNSLSHEQKQLLRSKLSSRMTIEGDLIVRNGSSRSQLKNKESALKQLALLIRNGLHAPKKRMKTKVSKESKEKRLKIKSHRSKLKKLRKATYFDGD